MDDLGHEQMKKALLEEILRKQDPLESQAQKLGRNIEIARAKLHMLEGMQRVGKDMPDFFDMLDESWDCLQQDLDETHEKLEEHQIMLKEIKAELAYLKSFKKQVEAEKP